MVPAMDWWIGTVLTVYWWVMLGLFAVTLVRPKARQTFFALLVQDPKLLPRDEDIPEAFQRELSAIGRGDGDADSLAKLFRALLGAGWVPPSRATLPGT
jgi:hypothetical protein